MQTFRKFLLNEYIPIMEKTFRSNARASCVAQRSIYIILRGNEETRSYINLVSNVPRHFFFCYRTCVRCNKRSTISLFLIRLTILRIYSNDRKLGHFCINEITVYKYFCSKIWSLCNNRCESIRWQELHIVYMKFRFCC
jgi:hypothetical protein